MTTTPRESNAYSIFILVLTVFALAIMVLRLLPLDEATDTTLLFYDNLICVVFLVDFAVNLAASHLGATTSSRGVAGSISSAPSPP